ncbi:MAG TPA: FkbM family methyltransferase [Xanthobacteraceae bacterium]|nr:FkbM family methyltransferase [Xanthobacteraceae bacterium]
MASWFSRIVPRPPRTWSRRKAQKLSHSNALLRLKSLGFAPVTIYDIGAYQGGWTRLAAEVFPAAQFVLFEANADHAGELAASGHRHVIAALGAEDAGARAFHVPRTGDVTGASLYVENTAHYAQPNLQVRELATARLDTLVARERLPPPELIKIDVQGAELDVLSGARETLRSASVLIVEVSLVDYNRSAPLIADALAAIDRDGFKCADLCQVHRTGRHFVLQLDLLFVRPPLFAKYGAAAGVVG